MIGKRCTSRVLAVFLALLLGVAVCSGCGKTDVNPPSAASSEPAEQSAGTREEPVSVGGSVPDEAEDPSKAEPSASAPGEAAEAPASKNPEPDAAYAEKTVPASAEEVPAAPGSAPAQAFDYASVPPFDGSTPYAAVNNNVPFFSPEEITAQSFEAYSNLDGLGRCGPAAASIGTDLMPAEERESISEITPTGWVQAKCDGVDGGWLYNRCHLLGFQLTGENALAENLITGTRFLNIQGMLPFENMVADYVKETGEHVMFRATPVFVGNELLCRGVLLEGLSAEDGGEAIQFNVFCYNAQPGVELDYATGNSSGEGVHDENAAPEAESVAAAVPEAAVSEPAPAEAPAAAKYIGNSNTGKFHHADCPSVDDMKPEHKVPFATDIEAEAQGYVACKKCKP